MPRDHRRRGLRLAGHMPMARVGRSEDVMGIMTQLVMLMQAHSAAAGALPLARVDAPMSVPKNGVFELSLAVPDFQDEFDEDGSRRTADLLNPFLTEIVTEFMHVKSGKQLSPNGFYDGGGMWRVRLSPPDEGSWTWSTRSDHPSLHGHSGSLLVTAAETKGCPRTSPKKMGFVYPDGTPYTPVGTTCYSWVHQDINGAQGDPDTLEQNTLDNLKGSPFNKVRMTGFPKWYPFTHHEPRYYPFMGKLAPASGPCHPPANTTCTKSEWDFTRFNPAFWQHYDRRVADVAALGIVPEIILFHPYDDDHWGFDRINRRCGSPGSTSAAHCTGPGEDKDCLWCDEHYIKYMVSRVSAYGTWWSMANEWDLEKSKTVADWDQLFQTLQQADAAHDRERSIHNCVQYYNHSKPWISHVSLQGHDVQQLDMAKAVWTQFTPKPIVWDEVMYEGNITYSWGGLSGYIETRRAWTAFTNQVAMAGHSNTDLPTKDFKVCMAPGLDPGREECNAIMWWNKGDVLRGESPKRLEWYKKYVSGDLGVKVPALDDTRSARLSGKEEDGVFELYNIADNFRILFWRNVSMPVEVDLGNEGSWDLTHVDWWGMKLTPMTGPALSGKVNITAPAGQDSILQLLKKKN